MLRRLKWKIVFIITIPVWLLIVVILTTITTNEYRNNRAEIESTLTLSFSQRLTDTPQSDKEPHPGIATPDEPRYGAYIMLLVDNTGRILERSGRDFGLTDESLTIAVETALKSEHELEYIPSEEVMYMKRKIPNGFRISIADTSKMYDNLNSTLIMCVLLAIGSLLLLFGFSVFLAGVTVAPVKKAWTQQKQFIADASHDLKTPLTVILANTNILMSHRENKIEEQLTWVESTLEESASMKKLIESMLFLARADEGKLKFNMSDTSISEITEKLVLHFEPIAFENGVEILSEIDEDIVLKSNEGQANKLFQSLIENAVKYTDEGKQLSVKLKRRDSTVKFTTENPGFLSNEDIEHIFDRFYRSDTARTENGFGLGLAIAKTVADSLGAKLYCECREGVVRFTVEFKAPKKKKEKKA